jgi:hypothetical protein
MASQNTDDMLDSGEMSSHTLATPTSQDKHAILYELYMTLQSVPETEHVNLLRIISNHGQSPINENSNGCFVNLSVLDDTCIMELVEYVKFIRVKNTAIGNIEKRMGDIETTYFTS